MASYPTLPWLREGTAADRDGGFEPVRATNGALKVRRLYSTEKQSFQIANWLTDAQKTTLESFYTANRLAHVTLTTPWDGASYTACFVAAPVYEWQYNDRWIARVRMFEV